MSEIEENDDHMSVCIYVITMNHSYELFIPHKRRISTTCYTTLYYVCNVINLPLYAILLIATYLTDCLPNGFDF